MKKKILFINSSNTKDKIGGTQTSLNYLIPNLKKLNYKVFFLSWSFKKDYGYYKNNLYEGIRLPDIRKHPFLFFIFIFKNYFIIKDYIDCNYIWVHSPLPWFFFSLLFNFNSKIIYTIHGPLKKEILFTKNKIKYLKLFLSNFILKVCIKSAKIIHYNSNYVLKESIKESKFLSKKKTSRFRTFSR